MYEERHNSNNEWTQEDNYYDLIDQEDVYERELHQKQDEFLDSYSHYLHRKTNLHKSMLKRKIIELELIDPNFDFSIE